MGKRQGKKKLKKSVFIGLIGCVLLIIGVAGYLLIPVFQSSASDIFLESKTNNKWTMDRVQSNYFKQCNASYQQNMLNWSKENEEFVGVIKIGNLIEEKVVQTTDNEKYLETDFDGDYDGKGTAFLDYRNELDDQNLIIYGHYVYYDDQAMFSPLHQLKEFENYNQNQLIFFNTPETVRQYEIAFVYYYEMGNRNLEYFHTNYGGRLENYVSHIQEKSFYDTSISLNNDDCFLTLQTCVRDREDLRLIVVAREIKE